ncbi:MAG: RNA-binding protein [Clostridiales bacterium]|nr:MAG: RNA-binding protein [Clostridiales bacterium]
MRLDKFLKVSRLIKRRTVAKDACDHGKVMINDKVAKAGTTIAVGDVITITFGERVSRYQVLKLAATTKKEDAADMYKPC